jgi:hypothetical protein
MSFFDPVDPPDFAAAATAGTAVAAAAPPPWPTAEPDQLVEIQRDHAGELVPREVHPHEVPEPEQRRGQLTGEAVVLEVDRAELHQAGEVAVTISVVLAARFPAMGAVAVLPAELFSTGEIIQVALDSLSGDPTRSSRRTLGWERFITTMFHWSSSTERFSSCFNSLSNSSIQLRKEKNERNYAAPKEYIAIVVWPVLV